MNLQKSSRTRWRVWLAGGVFSLLLLAAFVHEMLRGSNETFSFSDPGVQPLHPTGLPSAASSIPEIDIKLLSESLAQALGNRLDEWDRRNLEAFEKNLLAQMRTLREWRKGLDEKIETQFSRLQGVEQKLHSLERGMNRLLTSLEDEAVQVSMQPAFIFRGIEVWHGQAYALLEHQGRILPARQGDSRLGWRINAIDRNDRKLHISDGMTQLILEEQ